LQTKKPSPLPLKSEKTASEIFPLFDLSAIVPSEKLLRLGTILYFYYTPKRAQMQLWKFKKQYASYGRGDRDMRMPLFDERLSYA
jgi:hypothetical protein